MTEESKLDLAPLGFRNSALFAKLPPFDSIFYRGFVGSKIRLFETVKNGQTSTLASYTMIHKEESLLLQSFKDLMEHTLLQATASLQGFFEFNLLAFDIEKGTEHFISKDFSALLNNHGKKLEVGSQILIQYGKIFGLYKKRMKENWGKIDLVMAAENYTKPMSQFDLAISKIVRETQGLTDLRTIVMQDLSHDPIFRFGDIEQMPRMEKFLRKLKTGTSTTPPEIYVLSRGKAIELFSQFNLE